MMLRGKVTPNSSLVGFSVIAGVSAHSHTCTHLCTRTHRHRIKTGFCPDASIPPRPICSHSSSPDQHPPHHTEPLGSTLPLGLGGGSICAPENVSRLFCCTLDAYWISWEKLSCRWQGSIKDVIRNDAILRCH